MTSTDGPVDRRTVLKATGTVAAAGLLAGCSDDGGNDESNGDEEAMSFDGFFDGVDSYDGVVDETGSDSVTVTVGVQGNGGSFAFDPTAVKVASGTTVAFEWASDTHNVVVEDQPSNASWNGHESIENNGFSFEYTFETAGTYTYVCEPHENLGMKGAIVVE